MSRRLLDERVTGYRRVAGIDWPISTQLHRVQLAGARRAHWEITVGLCRGTPDRVESVRVGTAAREAYYAMIGEPHPAQAPSPRHGGARTGAGRPRESPVGGWAASVTLRIGTDRLELLDAWVEAGGYRDRPAGLRALIDGLREIL